MKERLIVAADLAERTAILELADQLAGEVGLLKIGLQAFISNGPELVREIRSRSIEVFLDLKLHDIPNTVERAVEAIGNLDVRMLTVHAAGGRAMLQAAIRAAKGPAQILGVTILTSLDGSELDRVGFRQDPQKAVVHLAGLCVESGVSGVVASPLEVEALRAKHGGLVIVTPGVRMADDRADDQRRTMTPEEAIVCGADYLVVGRPVTASANRLDAVRRIVESMEKGA